ncbi:dynein light chain 1, cytoplasmic [Zonotrichia albicollis]|uniref:dynein light chain 1, cytoplasmic n=1 Tax=Zonotrichia albicollis TaxID=44394 RepID=UPI003D80CBF8
MGAREAVPVANGGGRRSGGGVEALRGAYGPERSAVRSAAPARAVRCGAVRCGAVRCGAVRCGAVRCGAGGSRDSAIPQSIMSDRKAVIKNADMSEEMQQDSVECATQALEKYNIEKDIAAHIKKEFDKKYNPTWHCIVGRNFGSYVTHETKHFIYFYLGQVAILLFKSG